MDNGIPETQLHARARQGWMQIRSHAASSSKATRLMRERRRKVGAPAIGGSEQAAVGEATAKGAMLDLKNMEHEHKETMLDRLDAAAGPESTEDPGTEVPSTSAGRTKAGGGGGTTGDGARRSSESARNRHTSKRLARHSRAQPLAPGEMPEIWSEVKTVGFAPRTRVGCAGSVVGNRFFVFGGVGGCGGRQEDGGRLGELCMLDLDKLDAGWNRIKAGGSKPLPRSGHSCTVVGNEIWVFGGEGKYLGANSRTIYGNFYAFNTETLCWRSLPLRGGPPNNLLPSSRRGHTATFIPPPPKAAEPEQNSLVVRGTGRQRSGRRGSLRRGSSAGGANLGQGGKLKGPGFLVFGGAGPDRMFMQDIFLNDLQLCDISTMRWSDMTATGDGPSPRAGHTATLIDSRLYVMGGLSPKIIATKQAPRAVQAPRVGGEATRTFASDEMFVLDVERWRWHRPTVSGIGPGPRYGHTATRSKPKPHCVYYFGGRRSTHAPDNDVYILDTNDMRWSCPETTGMLPSPRYSHAAACSDTHILVFGGSGYLSYSNSSVYRLKLRQMPKKKPPPPPPPPPKPVFRMLTPTHVQSTLRRSASIGRFGLGTNFGTGVWNASHRHHPNRNRAMLRTAPAAMVRPKWGLGENRAHAGFTRHPRVSPVGGSRPSSRSSRPSSRRQQQQQQQQQGSNNQSEVVKLPSPIATMARPRTTQTRRPHTSAGRMTRSRRTSGLYSFRSRVTTRPPEY